ncbi:MAG: 2-oxoglutarate synthase [Candidatus Magasanikbacteria bacterium GW2011_GWA2_41_55]|nr:MAG: 2-oxoglutarate synthase [Candidatus Magasanikbacteria bacterium GW2011_GWA2_41_55]
MGLDIGCSLLAINALPINIFHTHHGRVTPTMLGFKRARPDSLCFGLTGDGGAYAIGWQSLFHSALRDEPITVIVVNNTVYAMTGGQTAPTTLPGQKTDTNPNGYDGATFFGPESLRHITHKDAYLARTAANNPKDIATYIEKAIATQSAGHFSLVEILSFCPTNWKTVGKATMDYVENLKKVYKVGEI